MRTRLVLAVGLLSVCTANVYSQVTLGRPTPLSSSSSFEPIRPVSTEAPRIVRGQGPPPPPAFPGAPGPAVFPTPAGDIDAYNKGMVNNNADLGGFWTRTGDKFRRCWDEVTGGASTAFQGGNLFKSDTRFQNFASPVTNPFFFEDPRALTEFRPIFIWQRTPSSNTIFNGGNNFVFSGSGSVAITPHISLVINRFGFQSMNPRSPTGDFQSGTGFSEVILGPKLSFGSDTSNSVFSVGLSFDIPAGSGRVLQNTGHTMLIPHFSYAQNFGNFAGGSFNFMNTTGYTFRTDNTRTEAFYSSFHLDFDWGNTHRIYPLVELNWRHYTRQGGARNVYFEANDLGNFGATALAGRDELTLALGTRVRFNSYIWWGIAAEFNVLKNGDGRHLDQFRLTTDLIFRY